ncbi:MAG: GtrA family protein [Oscillospiraceae bacterium]|nr:GtrA family protein [Oscillospiraceae bacterium]
MVIQGKYREQVLYLVFGLTTTLINWVIYIILINFLGLTISNAIAWIVAIAFAFHVNKLYVFRSLYDSVKKTVKEILMFLSARIITGMIELFGFPLLIFIGVNQSVFGIDGAVAKAIVTVIGIILNYVFSKFIIFKKS